MIPLSSPMICSILYTTTIRSNGGRRGWWRRVEPLVHPGPGRSRPRLIPASGARTRGHAQLLLRGPSSRSGPD
ncbi:unnamed protein product [Boreogadus saida]